MNMAAKSDISEGYGKILDAWDPPEEAGDPVGCFATTFTFSSAFFEEECLGRFLKLETDAAEDGPLYLIEREEKLAQVVCAAVLVDQHHCRGTRSLRWDLHIARPKQGILHAKISLLCWSRAVRVIIASANLTEDGYRRNREVYGVLDYHDESKAPARILEDVIVFLRKALELSPENITSPSMQRATKLLDKVGKMARAWREVARNESKGLLSVASLLTGPQRRSLFQQITDVWPGGSPPHSAWVLSPFFDPPGAKKNAPADAFWKIMRKKGETMVEYCLEIEPAAEKKRFFAKAPRSLLTTRPSRDGISVRFSRLSSEAERPLHAKELWLEDGRWAMLMIGSSNFTSAGTGVGKASNHEANLAYLLDLKRSPRKISSDLAKRFPPAELIDNPEKSLIFQPDKEAGIDAPGDGLVLPLGFISATYRRTHGEQGKILLSLGDDLPPRWRILDLNDRRLLSQRALGLIKHAKLYNLDWTGKPPSGLWVTWATAKGRAWWPVNVSSSADLPPPDELRDLPLDSLIDILTSARSLHEALRSYLRRKSKGGTDKTNVELDPHRRVDTSGFFLQRTRRFSWALSGLRRRLEQPVPTRETLDWRIEGPIGVMAVARAVDREAKSEDERVFLLAELALELLRVKPQGARGYLSAAAVRKALRTTAAQIGKSLSLQKERKNSALGRYLSEVKRQMRKN